MKQLRVFDGTKHEEPNHCLVNEYQPGRGIMPHEDGEAYEPVTATIRLGAVGVLELWEKGRVGDQEVKVPEDAEEDTNADSGAAKQKQPKWRILQEERSLLVTRGEAYTELLHGIAEIDRDERLQEVVNWGMLADKERFGNEGVCERGTRVSLTFRDVRKVAKVGAKLFGKR
jgi:alkylated DNA repair protein alkB family protein 6